MEAPCLDTRRFVQFSLLFWSWQQKQLFCACRQALMVNSEQLCRSIEFLEQCVIFSLMDINYELVKGYSAWKDHTCFKTILAGLVGMIVPENSRQNYFWHIQWPRMNVFRPGVSDLRHTGGIRIWPGLRWHEELGGMQLHLAALSTTTLCLHLPSQDQQWG